MFSFLQNKAPRRVSNVAIARLVRWLRARVRGVPAPVLIWTILACSATFCLLQASRKAKTKTHEAASSGEKTAPDIFVTPGVSNTQTEEEEKNEIASDGSDNDTAFGDNEEDDEG